ncbi:MAG: Y-family DNA polymerase [Muribaculaceae bacterium]|nr:Y-family DNA polymerase [Muribaculaceae bacterium]
MIGLADCNNFFVSCERSVDPSLEGRAVVVMSNNDGCIVARSNEAKALGIRMGQPAFEIRDLISSGQVIALSGQHLLYRDISLKIHDIFRKFVPHAIDYSIDESFLDMKGIPDNMLPAIGNEICRTCWNEMRIPVTIGFAQTKTLAKIITEYCKKNKVSVGILDNETQKQELFNAMPISELWGIGRRLSKTLYQSGIFTVADFVARNRYWIKSKLGVNGERSWLELHGTNCIDISNAERSIQDSISETRTFPEDIGDYDYLRSRIVIYSSDCARKLRKMNGMCRSVSVFLRTNRFHSERGVYRADRTLKLPCHSNDTQIIVNAAISGLESIFKSGILYKRAGVILSEITATSAHTPSLFADVMPDTHDDSINIDTSTHKYDFSKQNTSLMDAIDKINSASGTSSLKLASQLTFHTIGHNDGYSTSFQAPSKDK